MMHENMQNYLETLQDEELKKNIQKWCKQGFAEWMKKEMQNIFEGNKMNENELRNIFCRRLEFGTAGLRGRMGIGFNRMNELTVLQTSQGLCDYLQTKYGDKNCSERGVIIGYDGRHRSKTFAHVTSAVFLRRNFKVYLFGQLVATPIVSYGVEKLSCLCGIMVTASHNPKDDNGYKVYAENACQIIPPMDEEIAASIENNLEIWEGVCELMNVDKGELRDKTKINDPFDYVVNAYMQTIYDDVLYINHQSNSLSSVRAVYTPLHGVGFPFVNQILTRINLENNIVVVNKQKLADGNFPTVKFPNPEEKGALNLAKEIANENNISIIVANDPDADRFAAAEKMNDEWRIFTGDELGILLATFLMQSKIKTNFKKNEIGFFCSAVSSRMLQKMALQEGCIFEETLTGFKWIMNKACEIKNEKNIKSIFAYEEALGYAITGSVKDKDGICACAFFLQMCDYLYKQKKTISDYLFEIQKKYGFFISNNFYFLCYEKSKMQNLFDEFRNNGKYVWQVGKYKIKDIRDLRGFDSSQSDKRCKFPLSPSTEMVTLYFEEGSVVTLRTSGTEPKLKIYSEKCGDENTEKTKNELCGVVHQIVEHILKPERFNLILPKH